MQPKLLFHGKPKGISLIVTVTFMMIIAVMAVTFSRLSMYEQAATGNYCATIEAKFAAFAGTEFAIAKIYHDLRTYGMIKWEDNFSYGGKNWGKTLYATGNDDNLDSACEKGQTISLHLGKLAPLNLSYSGVVGRTVGANVFGSYDNFGNTYALKIKPGSSGKLNLNSHIALEATHQSKSNEIMRKILTALATRCGVSAGDTTAIVNILRPSGFTPGASKPENYKAFGTIEEVQQAISAYLSNSGVSKFLENICTNSWIDPNCVATFRTDGANYQENPSFYLEKRAPININSISKDLLYVLITQTNACKIYNDTSTLTNSETEIGLKYDTTAKKVLGKVEPKIDEIVFTDTIANSVADTLLYNGSIRRTYKIQKDIIAAINALSIDAYMKDALRSAFNPYMIDNFWNPTGDANTRVSKANIHKKTGGNPGHTTELCGSVLDATNIEVTSLGRITAAGNTKTIAMYQSRRSLNFLAQVMTHSSQKDFMDSYTYAQDIVFHPNYMTEERHKDKYSGWIELKANDPDIANPPIFGFTAQGPTQGSIKNLSDFFPLNFSNYHIASFNSIKTMRTTVPKSFLRSYNDVRKIGEADLKNNVVQDGLLSRYFWYYNTSSKNLENTTYFLSKALQDYSPNLKTASAVNVGNHEGTIEFWIKLSENEFGTDDTKNMPSGLFYITTRSDNHDINENESIQPNTAPIAIRKSSYEGTVLSGFINSSRQILISRVYWKIYYDDGHDSKSINKGSATGYWIGPKEKVDMDHNRKKARINVKTNKITWQPHEWHHVRICWDDKSSKLDLYLDGSLQSGTPVSQSSSSFCVIDDICPQDAVFINGIFRKQYYEATSSQHSIFKEIRGRVDFPGNATIDNFLSWGSHRGSTGIPDKRYVASAVYKGKFTIPTGNYLVGPILWTGYPVESLSGKYSSIAGTASTGIYEPSQMKEKKTGDVIDYEIAMTRPVNEKRGLTMESVSMILYNTYPKIEEKSE